MSTVSMVRRRVASSGGRLAGKRPQYFVEGHRDELAVAQALDVRGRQEGLAHVRGVAGGMALEVVA